MKKLMFAAAVAAGLAAFGDGIESANTVGYQQKAVRQFLSQQVCTFDAVGGGGLDLQKLIPVDANGDYIGDGDINVQFYNEYGLIQSAFAYYGDDEYDDDCPAGWYNEETDERVTFTFDPGQGFYVSAASACIFQYAGEVVTAQSYVPCRQFLSAQGNIRPMAVDIQTIIPVDGDDETAEYVGDGAINIQFCNEYGIAEQAFSYYGDDEYDDDCPAGWYNEETDERVTYSFAAGEGFLISASSACYLKFPALQ